MLRGLYDKAKYAIKPLRSALFVSAFVLSGYAFLNSVDREEIKQTFKHYSMEEKTRGYYLGKGAALSFGALCWAGLALYYRKEDDDLFRSFGRGFGANPLLTGGLAGLSHLMGTAVNLTHYMEPQAALEASKYFLALPIGWCAGSALLSSSFHNLKPPYLINVTKACASAFSPINTPLSEIFDFPTQYLEGLDALEVLREKTDWKAPAQSFSRMVDYEEQNSLAALLKPSIVDLNFLVANAFHSQAAAAYASTARHHFNGRYDEAFAALGTMSEEHAENTLVLQAFYASHLAKADALDPIGLQNIGGDVSLVRDRLWRETLDTLLAHHEFAAVYGKHILNIPASEFIKEILVIERGEQEQLRRKFDNYKRVGELFRGTPYGCPLPLALLEYPDASYLIIETVNGPPLYESTLLDDYLAIVPSLALVHDTLDYAGERDYCSDVKNSVRKDWSHLTSKLPSFVAPTVFNRDGHAMNTINAKHCYQELDYDKKEGVPNTLDVVKLTVQSSLPLEHRDTVMERYARITRQAPRAFCLEAHKTSLWFALRSCSMDLNGPIGTPAQHAHTMEAAVQSCYALGRSDLADAFMGIKARL